MKPKELLHRTRMLKFKTQEAITALSTVANYLNQIIEDLEEHYENKR